MGCFTCGKKGIVGKAKQVINGIDYYFDDINEDLFKERMLFCSQCPDATMWKLFCGHCKCILQAKLRLESERCPIGKWEAVTKAA